VPVVVPAAPDVPVVVPDPTGPVTALYGGS